MGWFSKQLIDVLEWEEKPGQLAWRFPVEDNEIQYGANLTVRDGQQAIFLDNGKLADSFGPGLFELDTQNLPIITSLENWAKGFESPFKSDVTFFSTREITGLKWGTAQPITVRDPEFGAIRIRAFGTYSFRIAEVDQFYRTTFANLPELWITDIEPQMRSIISTSLAAVLGSADTAFLDLAADQQKLSDLLRQAADNATDQWGIKIPTLFVESLSLPDAVQDAIDSGSSMRALGDLGQYARFKAADTLDEAAQASGGVAGAGAGVAAAMALGQTMSGGLMGQPAIAPPATPAAAAASDTDPLEMIEKLHKLHVAGALSEEEFAAKKAELLARLG
ncbi:SPFH domain-containing protein [Qipengyuania aurantiaca]|uniref:SPFH domain-containing protein n=1 Tax=Qipengyuania aurantiaca TaxID=2867233 RepID=A0ABX8ZML7_9SPHN|nr:SPFH domain-containing protein [Qipengyuania aurantiaca]QZD88949.1 SPFH domain-containing protein [Qipengyuania aurantiaca]